jgi:hypothetical protein
MSEIILISKSVIDPDAVANNISPALRKQRQDYSKFKFSPDYIASSCLKIIKTKTN